MFLRYPVGGGVRELRVGEAVDPAARQGRRKGDRDRGSSENGDGLAGRRLGRELGIRLARIVVRQGLHVADERSAAFDLQMAV